MSAPVPVLFVESYPQAVAGQQETLLALLGRCAGAGIAPTVATPAEGPFTARLREAGHAPIVIAQPAALARYGGAVYRDGVLRRLAVGAAAGAHAARLRGVLRKGGWRAVFCNDLRGLLSLGLAARLCGIPTLIWDKLDRPHGIYDALQLPLASRNLMIGHSVAAKYPRWQRRLWPGRMVLCRNGIDTARVAARAAAGAGDLRAMLGLGPEAVVAGLIGTISVRKGHDVALAAMRQALAQHPGLHLAVIGAATPETADFHRRLRQGAPPQVHWLGQRADVARLLGGLDLLISPSRHEGMGRVNLEAMAAGLPVIGTAATGIAEVVRADETGFLVPPGDAGALAARIVQLARDPGLRRRMGQAGRACVAEHHEAAACHDAVMREIRALVRA